MRTQVLGFVKGSLSLWAQETDDSVLSDIETEVASLGH